MVAAKGLFPSSDINTQTSTLIQKQVMVSLVLVSFFKIMAPYDLMLIKVIHQIKKYLIENDSFRFMMLFSEK